MRRTRANRGPSRAISSEQLPELIDLWLLAGESSQHSPKTISSRRERADGLIWFLRDREFKRCGTTELRAFFSYLRNSHNSPTGRWGNPRRNMQVSTGTVKSYHSSFKTFFRWLVAEEKITVSPLDRIPSPIDRPDQIAPFSDQQVLDLLAAARRPHDAALRDEAIVLTLLDTGMRASELCTLQRRDIDLESSQITIRMGKGGKTRTLPISLLTQDAIVKHMVESAKKLDRLDNTAPLFSSVKAYTRGAPMLASGLRHLIGRLGKIAEIERTRCSPHTLRHTFAVSFLRAGGHIYALRALLGHESLVMCQRYLMLAQADLVVQHRLHSPVDRLLAASGAWH